MDALRYEINYLTNLITDCIESGEAKSILIFSDGRVAELHGNFYHTHSSYKVDPEEPHISISLIHLLKEFVQEEELEKRFQPYTGKIKKVILSAGKKKTA
jgi:hypothetical protein